MTETVGEKFELNHETVLAASKANWMRPELKQISARDAEIGVFSLADANTTAS